MWTDGDGGVEQGGSSGAAAIVTTLPRQQQPCTPAVRFLFSAARESKKPESMDLTFPSQEFHDLLDQLQQIDSIRTLCQPARRSTPIFPGQSV
ncbi:hypothetical protein Taro_027940 [Colocasia esculenta]|uniref:Uncharacterized protein n=1 Tax=Colocasia esculenta TaxID=4460 RepID=A0A843VQB3_COLES|nr:hypothetical protein [Colocasia esculenta]